MTKDNNYEQERKIKQLERKVLLDREKRRLEKQASSSKVNPKANSKVNSKVNSKFNANGKSSPAKFSETYELQLKWKKVLAAYDADWPYYKKIVLLLKYNNKPLTSSEFDEQLFKLDKHYKKYVEPKKTLATILNRLHTTQRIIRIKTFGFKQLLFLLPDWVDKEGKPLDGYQRNFIDDLFDV
jgi:hypothetical protein